MSRNEKSVAVRFRSNLHLAIVSFNLVPITSIAGELSLFSYALKLSRKTESSPSNLPSQLASPFATGSCADWRLRRCRCCSLFCRDVPTSRRRLPSPTMTSIEPASNSAPAIPIGCGEPGVSSSNWMATPDSA